MVDLPSIPNNVPEVRAPQSRVSPEDIARPYAELGAMLDHAAGVAMKDIAEPAAERAGMQAVSRDDQGNLQVTQAPIFGDAALAFQRAVKFSALALGEAEAKREDLKLSKQFHENPDGYLAASKAFRDAHVEQFTKAAGPEVGIALGRAIDAATTYNYRYLLLEQQRNIKQNFDRDTSAGIKDAETDLFNLIETGGANTPAAKALINKVIDLHRERVNNPVLSAPVEQTRLELKAFDAQVGAAKFVYGINQILKDPDGGPGKAHDAVDAVLRDESLPPTQRVINNLHGLAAIKEFAQQSAIGANLATKQQKAKDDALENAIIKDSAGGKPTITENDIKNNPDMSPASKMRMLGWVKRDGMPEPLTKVSQPVAMDLFRRMNLDESDPAKVNDLRPIRDAYVSGKLKREDEEWLEKRFLESRSPEGSQLNQVRTQFNRAVEPLIDKSNPLMGTIDESGKMQNYAFQRFIDQKVDEYRKGGKNPADLFIPGKPDYLGSPDVVKRFQKPMDQSMRDAVERLTGGGATSAPAPKPQRQPGESPADYLKRIGTQ